jgi:hypothetical protein
VIYRGCRNPFEGRRVRRSRPRATAQPHPGADISDESLIGCIFRLASAKLLPKRTGTINYGNHTDGPYRTAEQGATTMLIRRINTAVELAMEYGGVRRVKGYLSDESYRAEILAWPDGGNILARAEAWFKEAEAYEALHGDGTKVVPDHWFMREQKYLRTAQAAQDAWLERLDERLAIGNP